MRTLKIVIDCAAVLASLTILLEPFATMGYLWVRKISVEENHLSRFLLMIYPLSLALFFHYSAGRMQESIKQMDKQGFLKQTIKSGKIQFLVRGRLAVSALSILVAYLVFNAFLIFNYDTLVKESWAASNDATSIQVDGETYGAQADKRGPIGGGRGYTDIVPTGGFVVENLDQLLDALGKAQAGQVIFIPGQIEIDCTARVYIEQLVLEIPGGVTLASNRGDKESEGALIYSDALKTTRLIRPMGPDVRITGLRIRGPNPKRYMDHHHRSFAEGRGHKYYYKFPTSEGIRMEYSGLEIDNCEMSGFSHAAIFLVKGDRHHIHHNFIHHCQYHGLGYGVAHDIASSLIEQN